MKWKRLAALLVFLLAVGGCGGDSVPLNPDAAAPQAQMGDEAEVDLVGLTESSIAQDEAAIEKEDALIEEDPLAEERRQVQEALWDAGAGAERQQTDSDFAIEEARLSATADLVPYGSIGGHTEFDGSDVRVFLPVYAGGYPVVLNSVFDEVAGMPVSSRVAGHSRHTWTLFDNGPLAVVSVRWNDGDSNDYLAWGWWVREGYGRNNTEAGAFFDGPELRGALPESMNLPLSGQAVYYGEATGLYQTRTRVHCTAFPCDIPNLDDLVGEFAADAKLVADFGRGEIEGCIGCQQGIRFTPAIHDLDSGDIERGSAVTRDYLFWLHRAGFLGAPHSKGNFAGDLTVVPLGGHAAGYGFWEGRFSNIADSAGNPRLLGATLHGQFEDDSTATSFTGVLSAESTAFQGSP